MFCNQGFQFGTLASAGKYSKYVIGYDETMKAIREGKAKLILVSRSVPVKMKSQIEVSAILANIDVEYYSGDSVKPDFGLNHMYVMAITDVDEANSVRSLLNSEQRQKDYGFF